MVAKAVYVVVIVYCPRFLVCTDRAQQAVDTGKE